jgi:hypothetical protein
MTEALCPACGSCGYPMRHHEDFAGSNPAARYCSTCAAPDGTLKPYDAVLKANADYLARLQGLDPAAARQLADVLLKSMPAWKRGGAAH